MGQVLRRVAAVAVAAAGWLGGPAAPVGAEPIAELGEGSAPSAVTDAAGTLHAVWLAPRDRVAYCRVPAGGTTCGAVELPSAEPNTSVSIHLRRTDGALIVVAMEQVPGDDIAYAWSSLDGGATWAGPAGVATGGDDDVQSTAPTPDGGAIELVGSNSKRWQRAPLAGGVETRVVGLGAGWFGDFPALGHLPDGRSLIAAERGGRMRSGWRVLAGGDPFTAPSWTPWAERRTVPGINPLLGTGPSGTWMLTSEERRQRVWRWNGARFVSPGRIGTLPAPSDGVVGRNGSAADAEGFAVDPAGRLHAVWHRGRFCGVLACLGYRRSEPRGFGPLVVYPLGSAAAEEPQRQIAVAPNEGGSGWIVWGDHFPTGVGRRVRALPLVTPPRHSRTGSRILGKRRRITIPTRFGCVRPGGRFVHRVLVRGRRGGVRIMRVRFFLDEDLFPFTDRRAPYRRTYRLTFPPLSRHVVAARVTYRLRGRTRTTTIGRMIVMCPA